MDLRKEIRSILKEVMSEAVPTEHYNERIYQRLSSSLYTRPAFDFSTIEPQLNTLLKINFDSNRSYAVYLRSYGNTFVSKDPETGKPSIGDEVWAVVRNNEINTIFFRNSHQKLDVKGVDETINIGTLYKYYKGAEKKEDGTVDYEPAKDKQGSGSRKSVELDLPMVELDGKMWYVDEKSEEIIFSKNIKKKISFDDLKDEYLEKVIDAVTV